LATKPKVLWHVACRLAGARAHPLGVVESLRQGLAEVAMLNNEAVGTEHATVLAAFPF